ncbi:CinA family protein [Streptomyces sp. KL118A]|uniref:CinA family protein n=1 Tax=Streptomyces sp. KL118A TaxID=3045153 RepID=UPI00278C6519|nr:CinA family protein [Streptomyces sp. KL118A]
MTSPGLPAAEAQASALVRLLAARGETLAVAESLTGGLVAAGITSVPGASKVFRGSVTAYATELKRDVLGVDGTLLDQRGAVDPEVARQMADGVRRVLGADWGIATTGVAGPEPQDGQPVGTVYVAVAGPDGAVAGPNIAAPVSDFESMRGYADGGARGKVAALRLNGDRSEIRMESVRSVLTLLHEQLTGERSGNGRAQDTEQNGGN